MKLPTSRRGNRRLFVALVQAVVLLVAALVARGASATTSLGASQLVFDSNRTGNFELFSMGFDGSSPRQITSDPQWDSWWPRLSPDRTSIVFYRTPAGTHDRDYTKTSLWAVNVDGTGLHQLIANGAHGWAYQGHAMWSPDGTQLVMFAGSKTNPQIWLTAADGSAARQLTSRPGTNIDPSWDPSGKWVLFISCAIAACTSTQYDVYRTQVDGSGTQQLTSDIARDQDPLSSPDGKHVAWLRQTTAPSWGVFLMDANGANQHGVVADLQMNSKPAWSDDGSWIFFHRLAAGQTSFGIWRVHPDGTGLSEIDGHPLTGPTPGANEFPDAGLF